MIVTTVKPTSEEVQEIILNQFFAAIDSEELVICPKLNRLALKQKICTDFFEIIVSLINEYLPYSDQTPLIAGEICFGIERKISPEPEPTEEEFNNLMERNTLFN